MSAMANTTPIVTTVTKIANKEKTPKEKDVAPRVNILDFCEEHYDDILSVIMDKIRHDKRKEVQTRYRDPSERPKMWDRLRSNDGNVASSRDPSHSRGRSFSRDRPRIRDRLCGVEESYDDTYSSHRTGTKYRDRSRDRDHSRSLKRWRESESPPSRGSKSSTSNRGHWKSKAKRRKPTDKEDLAVERWAMPTWCHMFNSTLIGAARVWFDELPPESIDGYKGLKAAFLAYFMQQKKYVKDPVEIHNIKQRDGEAIEEFMKHFKVETG
ncbi:reverse transcriptase domain-containing protein [Tanacetum coccineum]